MAQIDYEFEEITLCLGKSKDGKPQNIALISGTATINCSGRGRNTEWEIDEVCLAGPLCGDRTVMIDYGHPLFGYVSESLSDQCGDQIFDAVNEASQPDPDAAYDRMRDERMERA